MMVPSIDDVPARSIGRPADAFPVPGADCGRTTGQSAGGAGDNGWPQPATVIDGEIGLEYRIVSRASSDPPERVRVHPTRHRHRHANSGRGSWRVAALLDHVAAVRPGAELTRGG